MFHALATFYWMMNSHMSRITLGGAIFGTYEYPMSQYILSIGRLDDGALLISTATICTPSVEIRANAVSRKSSCGGSQIKPGRVAWC